jgi:hypothetical protein
MKNYLPLLFVCLFFACDDGDETKETSTPYFKVEVDPSYLTGATEDWIVIHNNTGTVLDYRAFESGDQMEFIGNVAPTEISVTLIRYQKIDGQSNYKIDSYLAIDPQTRWLLKDQPVPNLGSSLGQINVSIQKPGLDDTDLPKVTNRFSISAERFVSDNQVDFSSPVLSESKKFLLAARDSYGLPRFKFFETNGSMQQNIGVNELTYADQTIDIAFPETPDYYVLTKGYEPGQNLREEEGYVTNHHINFDAASSSQCTLGYLDVFENYYHFVSLHYNDYQLGYEALGARPIGNMVINNDIDATIDNKSFFVFGLSGNGFDWYSARWEISAFLGSVPQLCTWTVKAERGVTRSVYNMPAELLARFPILKQQPLTFQDVTVYRGTKPFEFYIGEEFQGLQRTPYEWHFKVMH